MLRSAQTRIAGVSLVAVLLLATGRVFAHGIVGNRLFIEPLVTEDANPKNEFDFPILEAIPGPDGHHVTFNYSLEKKLLPRFSLHIEHSMAWFTPGLPGASSRFGTGNFGLAAKYAFYKSSSHEFIMSGQFGIDLPTGDAAVGAEPFTTLSPEFLYAKGFGDLPSSAVFRWLRPFATQGDVGLDFPTGSAPGDPDARFMPRADIVLEYSVPYLNQFVRHTNSKYSLGEGYFRKGHSLGAILGNLFPFTEFNFAAVPTEPAGRKALGFFRPGVVYVGHYFEVGGAAELPANRFAGRHVGGIAIFDLFIDNVVPAFGRMLAH
jgi:hypothetical protein